MRRREFITLLGGAAAWPLAAHGQQSGRIVRIGILSTANPRSSSFYQSFERRLRDLGHIEGQNIVFEYRNAEGEVDRLPDLAAELTRLDPSIIVSSTDAATSAVKRATSTIPILVVAVNYDPIALGYVDNLARPGGNVTGLFFQHLELLVKRFGLLKEMLPSVSRVAVFFDVFTTDQLEIVQAANQVDRCRAATLASAKSAIRLRECVSRCSAVGCRGDYGIGVCAHLSRPHSDRATRKG